MSWKGLKCSQGQSAMRSSTYRAIFMWKEWKAVWSTQKIWWKKIKEKIDEDCIYGNP